MPITYDTQTKTARMNATRNEVLNGTLEITTSADAVLVTHGLDATAGTVTNAVWTLVLDAVTVAAGATGTAAKARVRSSAGVVRGSNMTVGVAGSGADVILDSVSVTSGQNVSINSATITHAA